MENEIKKLKDRIDLLEKIISNIQLRLGFAGEPHKDQTYGPENIETMLKNAKNRSRKHTLLKNVK